MRFLAAHRADESDGGRSVDTAMGNASSMDWNGALPLHRGVLCRRPTGQCRRLGCPLAMPPAAPTVLATVTRKLRSDAPEVRRT